MKKNHLLVSMLFFVFIFAQAACATPEYLVPDAAVRNYTPEEIADMSVQIICYAKNEIYARHGRRFVSQELNSYFTGCSWYKGTVAPDDFSDSIFNEYEMQNVMLLADREEALLPGGYVLDQEGYSFEPVKSYLQSKYGSDTPEPAPAAGAEPAPADTPEPAPAAGAEPAPAVDPDVSAAYQEILENKDFYFPKYQEEPYVAVDYSYAFTDMTGDGFPELLLAASGGKNYTAYDGSVILEYWPAEIRVFSWDPAANQMYAPEGTLTIGAAPVGGFRGQVWASANHDCLLYGTWSSGTSEGEFYSYTLSAPYTQIEDTQLLKFGPEMLNDKMVPYEYENLAEEIDWITPNAEKAVG